MQMTRSMRSTRSRGGRNARAVGTSNVPQQRGRGVAAPSVVLSTEVASREHVVENVGVLPAISMAGESRGAQGSEGLRGSHGFEGTQGAEGLPDPWAEFRALRAQLNALTERLFQQAPVGPTVVENQAPVQQPPEVVMGIPVMKGAERNEPRVAAVDGERKIGYLTVMDHMSKLGTRYFRGGPYPIEADEWRTRVERNFQSTRCPEDYRTDIAVHFLEGDAHTWWEGVVARQGRRDLSWETFREEFTRKYFPPEAHDRLECAFLDLQQGTRKVREYEEEFNRLRRYAGKELDDERVQIRRFMRGLRIDIRNRCLVRNYASIGELVEKAALLEAGMEEEQGLALVNSQARPAPATVHKNHGRDDRKRKREGPSEQDKSLTRKPCGTCGKTHAGECWLNARVCRRCGSKDHLIKDCPQKGQGGPEKGQGSGKGCFHCGKEGHFKRECPMLAAELRMIEQDRGGELRLLPPPPPPKRSATGPRLYAMNEEAAEASNSMPITGVSE